MSKKLLKGEVIKRLSYFGGKRIKYIVKYSNDTEETISEEDLLYKMHGIIDVKGNHIQVQLCNAKEGKNGNIILDTDDINYTAKDFFDRDLNIGDTVLVSFADPANYGRDTKHYAKMIYGEILDIVENNLLTIKILKIYGKSARYNYKYTNMAGEIIDSSRTIIENPIDSRLTVKYTYKE